VDVYLAQNKGRLAASLCRCNKGPTLNGKKRLFSGHFAE